MKKSLIIPIVCIFILVVIVFSIIIYFPKTTKLDKADLRGTIKSITVTGDKTAILYVEGKIESDTSMDKASVRIDGYTTILNVSGEKITVNDLDLGNKVNVVFSGPIAESYPAQGYAKSIVVLK